MSADELRKLVDGLSKTEAGALMPELVSLLLPKLPEDERAKITGGTISMLLGSLANRQRGRAVRDVLWSELGDYEAGIGLMMELQLMAARHLEHFPEVVSDEDRREVGAAKASVSGEVSERTIRRLLRDHLPLRYGVVKGHIAQTAKILHEFDIIIYDALNDAPVYYDSDWAVIRRSAVLGVVEVKSDLANGLEDALTKIGRLHSAAVPSDEEDPGEVLGYVIGFKCQSVKAAQDTLKARAQGSRYLRGVLGLDPGWFIQTGLGVLTQAVVREFLSALKTGLDGLTIRRERDKTRSPEAPMEADAPRGPATRERRRCKWRSNTRMTSGFLSGRSRRTGRGPRRSNPSA